MTGCLGRNRQFIEQLSRWLSTLNPEYFSLRMLWMERLWQENLEKQRGVNDCRNFILHQVFASVQPRQWWSFDFSILKLVLMMDLPFFRQVGSWVFCYIPDFGGSVFQAEYVNSEVPRFKKKPISIRHPPVIPWGERRCFFWGIQFLRAETHHLKGSLASMGGNCLVCFTPKIPYNTLQQTLEKNFMEVH